MRVTILGREVDFVPEPISVLPQAARFVRETITAADDLTRKLLAAQRYRFSNDQLDTAARMEQASRVDLAEHRCQLGLWRDEHPDADGLAGYEQDLAEFERALGRVADAIAARRPDTVENCPIPTTLIPHGSTPRP